jgi:hypothetical protein
MAGLDKPSMPFSGEARVDPDNHPLNSSQSRHNTTLQMRSFLEQSRLDDSSFLSDVRLTGYNDQHSNGGKIGAGFSRSNRSVDPTLSGSPDKQLPRQNGGSSKFDELYRKALEDTENSISATLPSMMVNAAAEGRRSGAPSEKSSRSESDRVASLNVANSDRSRVVNGKSDHSDRLAQNASNGGPPQPKPRAFQADMNRSTDSERSKVSLQSIESDRSNRSGLHSAADGSGLARRAGSEHSNRYQDNDFVDEGSDEYTTDDDGEEIEEIDVGVNSR